MTSVIELADDSEFMDHLNDAGQKLVVVDFTATWCGPCTMIAPFFKQLSTKYPNALFLKVDVDKCPGTAAANEVNSMPTFILFRNRTVLDRIRGANKVGLEDKVKQFYDQNSTPTAAVKEEPVNAAYGGHVDLVSLINKKDSECLNQDDDHTWEHALTPVNTVFLQSDCDSQILLNISFSQAVKIHSLIIQGPEDNGPKDLKIFINQTKSLSFDEAESFNCLQAVELKPEDLKDETLINLFYVKFQNVQNITLFFNTNQSGSETTVINYLKFIGSPKDVTDMKEFKRVSGQAGESHG
jgi:thioredoxin